MFQQADQQNEARKYTAKDWEDRRPDIARLYESGTLESVIKSMREQYGFEATPKQYKDRIGKWGLNKNIQRDEMEAMIKKRQERESESNKQTAFRIRGRPVNEEKIERYMRDHPKQLATDDDIDMERDMSPADTPAGISCYTPSGTGSLTPQEAPSLQTSLRPRSNIDPQHSNDYVNGNPNDPPPPPQGTRSCSPGAPQYMPEYPGSGYHGGYGRLPQPNYIPPQTNYGPPQQGGYAYGYGYYGYYGYQLPPPPQGPYGYYQPPPQQYGGYNSVLVNNSLYSWPGLPSIHSNSSVNGNLNTPPPPPQGPQAFQENRSFGPGAPQGYSFQYSNCTGRRKALLIGINYFGQRGQLRGCINDVKNMSSFLHENFGYHRDDMVILTDDQQNPMSQPTKQNILWAMHWLVKDAMPNDSLFFHYSGHGGQTKDLDGDEEDGYDEVIYPVDFRQVGHIVDDEMHRIMVKSLQPGVRLTAIFDSCHSGTALDLPYIYSTQGILKEPNLAKEAGAGLLGVISSYSHNNVGGVASKLMGFFEKATTGDDAYNKTMATKTSPADVIMWSSGKDDQTSADATIAAQATGAMSWAFITAMKKNSQQSFDQLLNSIRDELATKYTQKPQLSCSHPLNTNLLFVM